MAKNESAVIRRSALERRQKVPVRGTRTSLVQRNAPEKLIAEALKVVQAVAMDVYGDGAVLNDPEKRFDRGNGKPFTFLVVEVPQMENEDFMRLYEAFLDGVVDGIDLAPDVLTLSVQSRAAA